MFLTKTVSTRTSVFLLLVAVLFFFVTVYYAHAALNKIDMNIDSGSAMPS
jgi:hypothetical protein